MQLLVIDGNREIATEIVAQVVAAQTAVHGSPSIHDPALYPYTLALIRDDTVVGVLDVLTKDISHVGRQYRVSGLSWVLVPPQHRARGYGHHLIHGALHHLQQLPIDLVLFTCDRPLKHFYESAGYRFLPEAVLVGGTPSGPFPSDQPGFDKVTMASFISAEAKLHSADFAGCRIELHSGDIDRLW